MFIKINNVDIEGFQSIEKASISLSNQGVVLVKGINNFESKTSSNGSGKSSIFEALIWAIYGKTSSGISDPRNRYLNTGCKVELEFSLDSKEYKIIRAIGHKELKNTLKILNQDIDLSGRNKTDTEKIIKNDIFPFSQDIFLSIIFLNQGFSGRLGALNPSGRKERIELLTDTTGRINSLRDSFINLKSDYLTKSNDLMNKKSYCSGTIDSMMNEINKLESKLNNISNDIPDESRSQLEELASKYNRYNSKLLDNISTINSEISKLNKRYSFLNSEINRISINMRDKKSKISEINNKICPTCGNKISDSKSDELIAEYKSYLSNGYNEIVLYKSEQSSINSEKDKYEKAISSAREKYESISSKLKDVRDKISKIDSMVDVDEINSLISDYNSKIEIETKNSNKLEKDILKLNSMVSVANHCASIVSKQFRGYLLSNIISFMNSRLVEYSSMLFSSGDIIRLEIDSVKLDIYLGDSLYDTLSGGEKRKVDLALMFMQRDLSMNILGVSSNIMILDEVMDNLDEIATNAVLDMISVMSDSVDSIFIISHNNYSIPYDSIINVIKDSNRLSRVILS